MLIDENGFEFEERTCRLNGKWILVFDMRDLRQEWVKIQEWTMLDEWVQYNALDRGRTIVWLQKEMAKKLKRLMISEEAEHLSFGMVNG